MCILNAASGCCSMESGAVSSSSSSDGGGSGSFGIGGGGGANADDDESTTKVAATTSNGGESGTAEHRLSVAGVRRSVSLSFVGGDVIRPKTSLGAINKTSDTSNGFQLTLDVLEKHVKRRRLCLKQRQSSEEAHPAATARSFEEPTNLDLQLKAIERLKQLSGDESSVAKLLINFVIANEGCDRQQKVDKIMGNLQAECTSPQLYHIAREKRGDVFLRVIRSPSSDKGRSHECQSYPFSEQYRLPLCIDRFPLFDMLCGLWGA